MACNSACALCDMMALKTFSAWYCRFPFYNSFLFLFLEDPAAFCIAMELVSQLSFCVKLSCEKELYGKLFYDLLYFSLCVPESILVNCYSLIPQPIFRCGFMNLTQTLGSMNWLSTTINCAIMWCNLIQCWAEGDIGIQLADQNFLVPRSLLAARSMRLR